MSPRSTRPGGPGRLDARRLYLCTPDRPDLQRFVDSTIRGGVDVVQLRDKFLPDRELVARAGLIHQVCREHGVPFILNDRPDLAGFMGADGVHVGQGDMPPTEARLLVGPGAIVGLSTHAPQELAAAVTSGDVPDGDGVGNRGSVPIDYVSAGPVVATPTKPGRPGTGIGYVRHAVSCSPWSVWITGGVGPESIGPLVSAGARHFVAVRWLTEAADPMGAARSLRQAIDGALDAAAEDASTARHDDDAAAEDASTARHDDDAAAEERAVSVREPGRTSPARNSTA